MLSRAAIRSTADVFWSKAGGRAAYGSPVQLERAVVRTLPIAIHRIAYLTTLDIASYSAAWSSGGDQWCSTTPAPAALIADVGVGFMFVDSNIQRMNSA